MNSFVYENKTKVYFGVGVVDKYLKDELKKYGGHILLVYGKGSIKKTGIYKKIVAILEECGKEITELAEVMPNPTFAKVQEGAVLAREHQIDLILAVGGGSVIDCCKIISAQAKTERNLWEMEFVEHEFPKHFIPMGAIVTATGTGAEMNAGAVITNEKEKLKSGMLGAQADFAMIDPAYTLTLPMEQAISGAFDTFSHCMETYFGKPDENNLSDEINEAIMRSVIRNMRLLKTDPENISIRSELAWASSMAENGILKIGKITDFQGHMIEHQLGAYTDCNHGQGLAVIMPILYRHIYKASIPRFARYARNVWGITGDDEMAASAGIEKLSEFVHEMGLPKTFTEMGLPRNTDYKAIADSCPTTAGCCKKLTSDDIYTILKDCA